MAKYLDQTGVSTLSVSYTHLEEKEEILKKYGGR